PNAAAQRLPFVFSPPQASPTPPHPPLPALCPTPRGLPLPLSSVPAMCSLELRRTLRTVGAALETFDVVGGVRIVFLAPALDDQLIASATAEWVRQGLGRILDRIAIHIGEVVSVDGAHGCTF